MIEQFKQWLLDVQEEALAEKRRRAKVLGDEAQWKRQIWKSTDKNRDIKAKFDREGQALGYRSRPSAITGAREWLYDFAWRRFDGDGNLLEVPLVMEIEMSDQALSQLRYDFNKLLLADAAYRVFVFQLKTEADVHEAMTALKTSALRYQSRLDAHILIGGWVIAQNQFHFTDFPIGMRQLGEVEGDTLDAATHTETA